MSENFGSPGQIQPLSVGNVVSAAVRLYRSHLKDYFLLALKAYVWVLVPVYGWAKFYALSALISRLAFGELVNQPESISSGERYVNSRLWQFLVTMLLMLLISIGIGLGVVVLFVLFGFLSAFVGLGQQGNPATSILIIIFTIVVSIVAVVAVFWLLTRFYLVDVPLAIEDNINGVSTISRSWELTQGHVWRILSISFVAFLITIPAQIALQIISTVIQVIFLPLINENSTIFSPILIVLILAFSFSTGAIILPFWQAIKAVIYYDMRSRREGLGLQLRDRKI
ncbi:DUF975 domain-containing protein [Nostoc commune]|uniref:DUF975 domain-containing protein n=1 Tax=Nostoc commune TaxID=1178 RepID=UPI0018C81F68|nr:DUF975 domain-containing protein [Nostoc commune]MBG1262398.1 DUF975 domain-containing protein [Nostoc commune BAE]